MIGSAKEAETILAYYKNQEKFKDAKNRATLKIWDRGDKPVLVKRPKLPFGWKLLGEGCFRKAYLSPSGVVYKLQRRYPNRFQTNVDEYNAIVRILIDSRPVSGVRLAKSTLYMLSDGMPVMAMEYINSDWKDILEIDYNPLKRAEFEWRLEDMHDDNFFYIPEQKEFVLTDVAC